MLKCRYSNDVDEIANARNGDVIAYASALAMVRRLHRAFAGSDVERLGGLRPIAIQQARRSASSRAFNMTRPRYAGRDPDDAPRRHGVTLLGPRNAGATVQVAGERPNHDAKMTDRGASLRSARTW